MTTKFPTKPLALIGGVFASLAGCVFCVLIVCLTITKGQSRSAPQPPQVTGFLPLIEKYKAPPFPKSTYIDRETYDYRIQTGSPLPKTLTDVFICDIWQRITMDLKSTITPTHVTEEIVREAINVYLHKDWSDIAGYRPWTHWNFIRKLKTPERNQLASEITACIIKNGIRDREEATDRE